ncbi:Isopropylmalate/homocitrate/citramalate synthases [Caloramator quimbayensis]|uniref:Isopropylmalate/homocitrate/citramalate synthases n=2 Tax=Caloramator quimbayensis TaxID=1147123 RepID=A0A1T4X5F5_9CLOT|nr:2-isopropylmalate synthase [Caloramator quimbayensis]SKA84853.1 Isopropylmalate/homocitrate/citramalate synthases [Caloramator quimbayensis]
MKAELNNITNLMELKKHDYTIEDVDTPNLYRHIFPYSEIPKITFNYKNIPIYVPDEIWITDTTFRDGQQAISPFTTEQIVTIYEYLHKLDNNSGIIRQTEFFLYTERDRKALEICLSKGYKFPEITTWIRAKKEDFKLVKDAGVKETGILMSCSDYHIFKKLNMTRRQALNQYLSIASDAFENGIIPRCHLEDITRADFFGFVVPLVNELNKLSQEAKMPFKIRICDTLGLGVSFPGVELPRSIPAIVYGLRHHCNLSSENLEWHGHNDFYSVVTNSTAAWLYGASSVNTSLLGIGERTGNCPLEAMLIQYGQLRGNTKNMRLELLTEIAEYFEKEINYSIPPRTPFVGKEFNVTRAGVHADGILKNEEIYNIFDTGKILNRPLIVAVNEYSGLAGIAAWINTYFKLADNKIDKKHPIVQKIKDWVDSEYEKGRTTVISNSELEESVKKYMPDLLSKINNTASKKDYKFKNRKINRNLKIKNI